LTTRCAGVHKSGRVGKKPKGPQKVEEYLFRLLAGEITIPFIDGGYGPGNAPEEAFGVFNEPATFIPEEEAFLQDTNGEGAQPLLTPYRIDLRCVHSDPTGFLRRT
jgi:hypothetical protein